MHRSGQGYVSCGDRSSAGGRLVAHAGEARAAAREDPEDRARCLDELWRALVQVRADEDRAVFDEALRAWRLTAEALADPERREVLLGSVEVEDFAVADRPG
jgi:hypothetical protein